MGWHPHRKGLENPTDLFLTWLFHIDWREKNSKKRETANRGKGRWIVTRTGINGNMAQVVTYCGVCTLPVEFCEFGKSFKKCKAWLENVDPARYNSLYGSDATVVSSLSSERETQITSSLAKMQLKEERKQEREAQNLKNSKILIKRIPRTKHKHIVAISNLEVLGPDIDLKKIAKVFASKFATGSSVSKNAEKKDEIVIQGDVANEVEEYLNGLMKEKGIDVKIEHVTERFTNKKK